MPNSPMLCWGFTPIATGSTGRLIIALRRFRGRHVDNKRVWHSWRPNISTPALADALWPVLESKMEAAHKGDGSSSIGCTGGLRVLRSGLRDPTRTVSAAYKNEAIRT